MKQLRSLFPHQEEALSYLMERKRGALFMEMRLGKTIPTIRWLQQVRCKKILVVGPVAVLPGWESELLAEGYTAKDYVRLIKMPVRDRLELTIKGDFLWHLINYEALVRAPEFCDLPWDAVVLDESTKIRKPTAKISKLCMFKFSHVPYRAILSGLPAPESDLDYYCQFKFLYGQFCGRYSYYKFRDELFNPPLWSSDWIAKPGTFALIKQELDKLAFSRTRKQCNIGSKKLPPQRRVLPLPKAVRKFYDDTEKEWALLDDGSLTSFILVVKTWLSRIAGGFHPKSLEMIHDVKLQELNNLITGELKGQSVVIWYRLNAELLATKKFLEQKGYKVAHVLGGTHMNAEQREQARIDFQAGKVQFLLAQVKCAKYGLNCSKADTAIYYSNTLEYEDRAQSEDRIIHVTKTTPVLYIDLVIEDSIDEDIIWALRRKGMSATKFSSSIFDAFRERLERKGMQIKEPEEKQKTPLVIKFKKRREPCASSSRLKVSIKTPSKR
jgi:SNF2 family DNA or RNA helicase